MLNRVSTFGRASAKSMGAQMLLLLAFFTITIVCHTSANAAGAYNVLRDNIDVCALGKVIDAPSMRGILAPTASLCVNGALAAADPDFNRPLASSTGTGVGNGTVGNCSLSGTATAANYDAYNFAVTGCAAFPTEVTATLCGPAGCQHVGNIDTTLVLYRNVAAAGADRLTTNGGLPRVFNPASPCTNAVAQSDDLGTTQGAPNNPGGATCNQVNGAQCVAPCTSPSAAGSLSGFRRQLGDGLFTLVVDGFGNTTTGAYNLYVEAPAAGCVVTYFPAAPTAASVAVSGRALTADNRGIKNVSIQMTGANGATRTTLTGANGFYRFADVAAGETYILTARGKAYSFSQPTQVVSVGEEETEINFVAYPSDRVK